MPARPHWRRIILCDSLPVSSETAREPSPQIAMGGAFGGRSGARPGRVPRGDSSMSTFELTRRAAFVVLFAFARSPAVAARRALARAGPSGGIRVAVAPLLENSGEPAAGLGGADASRRHRRTGVSVALTIDSVILGPNSGGVGPGRHGHDRRRGAPIAGDLDLLSFAGRQYGDRAVELQPRLPVVPGIRLLGRQRSLIRRLRRRPPPPHKRPRPASRRGPCRPLRPSPG